MTIIHNLRVSSDEDFKLIVEWTRNDVPVVLTAANLVVTVDEVDTVIATLGDGITQVDEVVSVDVPQVSLPTWVAGVGDYVLAVESVSGEKVRLVEGGLSIQRPVVTW